MNVDAKDPQKQDRDQYIQSKGHAAEVLWAVLTDKGFAERRISHLFTIWFTTDRSSKQ